VDLGIFGAGNIGATAARLFARAGHRVEISDSRAPGRWKHSSASSGLTSRP
jgi:predicted dinucleotide-binding enzyme